MAIQELTADEIRALVGSRLEPTGIQVPPAGLQPYYDWLIQSLDLLSQSSAGDYRVALDDASATTVRVAPGRASIGGIALSYAGGTFDLAIYNNDTALIALEDNAASPAITLSTSAAGWPVATHIKLAETTLSAGQITSVLDRRFETMLSA